MLLELRLLYLDFQNYVALRLAMAGLNPRGLEWLLSPSGAQSKIADDPTERHVG